MAPLIMNFEQGKQNYRLPIADWILKIQNYGSKVN